MNFFVTIPNRVEKEHQLWMLNKCLESLFQCEPSLANRVVIVDDLSPIDIMPVISKYPVKLLRHKTRVSYSKMINSSMKLAKQQGANCLITVNNDIEHQVPFLDKLRFAFDADPFVHVIGAWLLFPDGKTQHSGVEVINMRGPWAEDRYRDTFDHSLSRYCHHVTGAWQAIRLNQVTLQYDERFAFAFEDVDFCLRNWEIGRRTYFLKNIVHIHHEGATRGRTITPIQMESAKTFRETEYDWDGLNHHLNFALTNGGLLGTRHLISLPVSSPHAPQS